jgi:undecaprenyl-diphosphatase
MLAFYVWLLFQILLESFPISSSGHRLLFELYLKKFNNYVMPESKNFFNFTDAIFPSVDVLDHFAHGATVFILIFFFFSSWFFLLRHVRRCWRIILKIILFVGIADFITSIFYIVFKIVPVQFPLSLGFAITGCSLASLYWCPKNDNNKKGSFNVATACVLGLVQGCALLPGISRLATTYACARWLHFSPQKSFQISWLIAWPLITAAFLNSTYILIKKYPSWLMIHWPIFVVIFLAGIASYFMLCFSARLAYTYKFWKFSIYMIVPIVLSILLQ